MWARQRTIAAICWQGASVAGRSRRPPARWPDFAPGARLRHDV